MIFQKIPRPVGTLFLTPPLLSAHQYVLALGETHGNLGGLAADVHQFRVDFRDALGEEQDGVLVLLLTHPGGGRKTNALLL